jgi:tRNA A37 threonylcarbamoyladenosine synthetase subunit TsaC/SUA5/YrdC
MVVDGGECDATPSTVVDATTAALRCLRDGAVPWRDVEEVSR